MHFYNYIISHWWKANVWNIYVQNIGKVEPLGEKEVEKIGEGLLSHI